MPPSKKAQVQRKVLSGEDLSPEERRRNRSTLKEKRRNVEINNAFDQLQLQLPSCVPKNSRLPKIKTLRLAIKYMEHLSAVLNGDVVVSDGYSLPGLRPVDVGDFANIALQEIQARNAYTDRVKAEQLTGQLTQPTPPPSAEQHQPEPVPYYVMSTMSPNYAPMSNTQFPLPVSKHDSFDLSFLDYAPPTFWP